MLGIEIELQRTGRVSSNPFVERMDGIERRAEDMTPALEAIYKSFRATERGLFSSNGGRAQWAPLTPAYARRKAKLGLDPRTMRATGELYRALGQGSGPGAVKRIDGDGADFGTSLAKALYAHRGSGRRRRRLVTADRARRAKWVALIRSHLVEGAGT